MPFIILISLIFIHELGHFIMAMSFKIEVDKIYIYPFGGISKFNIEYNENTLKEFIILIMGPLFQVVYCFILCNINYLSGYKDLIIIYNYTLLSFNLLPIYPLDGGKLLNMLLSLKLSFKKSYIISIYISYITIISIFIFTMCNDITINMIIIISFLLYKVSTESKKRNYVFYKFLLERYLNNYNYKKRTKVSSINDFMKGKKHILKRGNKYYTEKDVLKEKFSNKY